MINDVAGDDLQVKPLGAGDLIDRAVRFYRKFFWTFVLIASPPVILGTMISIGWMMIGREVFAVTSDRYSPEYTFYYLFLWFGSVLIWLAESIGTLVVMGGASRNFVRHLLFGEAITFRQTYVNVWGRLGGLITASTIMTVFLGILGVGVMYLTLTIAALGILLIVFVLSGIPVLAFIVSVAFGLAAVFGGLWLFFLAASRLAYVPQVMLVEGQGVFAAMGRSASLAGRNVSRLTALFIFTTAAAYSAIALFYVPLVWYASAKGVQIMSFDRDALPAWYEIASNVIWQMSFILLSPVWTAGLCLLYVDERVRTEGYDIELMAARRLGDIPSLPESYISPLQPALAAAAATDVERGGMTTLGLK